MCLLLKLRIYSQGNFVFDSTNMQINALNINTKESEFGPFKIDNRLYYTSSRERKVGVINLDRATGHQMLDLYSGDLKDSVTVTNRRPLRNKINNSLNQGSAFFDKQSSKLYYAGNVPADWAGQKYKLAIFSTELKGDKFLKPRVELLLPDTFLVSHPMVYNNRLYFSSNMKGGKGRADIYCAELVNGKWTNIRNLELLNSPYDEYFPFVINEQEIYFSSNRPGGFGRLDLYKYTVDDSSAHIENLGKPINSSANDYGIYVDQGQDKGYFTTSRNGDQDDIYYFKKTWPTFNNCLEAIKETYCFDFTDEKSLETDSIKGYFYEWDFGDGVKQKGISVTHCYAEPGNYLINLNIVDVSTKAVFLNQTSVDLKVDSIVQLNINALDTMLVNKKFTVNTVGTYLPDKKITGYYFEVDDKRLRTQSFEYAFPKPGKYKIKLGVEYDDLATKKKGLMCTTLEVNCVDSAAWLPFEQRTMEQVIEKIHARNVMAGVSGMEDMNYDAELAYNARLGLNREKLADKIDDYLSSDKATAVKEEMATKNLGNNKDVLGSMNEDAELAFAKKQQQDKEEFYKNLRNNKDGMGSMGEDAELAFKQKQQKEKDEFYKNLRGGKDVLGNMNEDAELSFAKKQQQEKDEFYKNLRNNKDALGNMSEDAELAFKMKQQKDKEEFYKNLRGGKDVLGNMSEDAELAFKKKQQAEEEDDGSGKKLHSQKNEMQDMNEDAELVVKHSEPNPYGKKISVNLDTLLNLNEAVSITFRVHLGKSKTAKDTNILNSKGLFGIKEEFINNEYYYSYGSEERVNSIEKYYKKALKAGVKEPVIIAYKNNVLIPHQAHNFRVADFGEPVKPQTIKEKIIALFKKDKPKHDSTASAHTAQPVAHGAETPVRKDSAVIETPAAEPEEPMLASNAAAPINKKPTQKKDGFIYPAALKPDDVKLEDVHTPEGETATAAKNNLAEFVAKYGDAAASDLQFMVQISAFKFRNRYEFPHLAHLGKIENTLTEGGITRITIGGKFDTYKKALEHNKKVIAAGQKDAFVTAFYKGKRVYIENLEKMGIFVTK